MSEETNEPPSRSVTFKCFDLETTDIDVATCEVVQAAVVEARAFGDGIDLSASKTHTQLFAPLDPIPRGASLVHGIVAKPEDALLFSHPVTVIPETARPFGVVAKAFVVALTEPDVVAVTFNGVGFDIPVVARYLSRVSPGVTQEAAEARLRARHIDVMRLWARAQANKLSMPWECGSQYGSGGCGLALTADMFAGGLRSAYGFYMGSGFDGAHDASVDCVATLAVLDEMLLSGFVTVETAIAWSNQPLPGDCDFAGKFKWEGDQCVITFKVPGTPIEDVDVGFLKWILGKDFPTDTKELVRRFLAGEYPQRKYEDEAA